MHVIPTERIPIKCWCNNPDSNAIDQAKNLANLPFAFKHIALMPDVHSGYGMPIGGVLATENVIIPNAVGVDIGCGMCAIKTSLKMENISIVYIKNVLGIIRNEIPVGMNRNNERQCIDILNEAKQLLDIYFEIDNNAKDLGFI